jgi:DNA-directed RNA polymerase specialized sigma24 family protein
LEWKYLDRVPVEEIATRLGLGAKAAESLLTRARQAFRTSYESLQTLGEV